MTLSPSVPGHHATPWRLVVAAAAFVMLAASPAAASKRAGGPTAHMSGGDLTPAIPAIIRTHVRHTQNALDRLDAAVDGGDAAQAAKAGKVIRRQLAASWRGTKYYVKHAPPPVADEARVSGDGGSPAAAIADAPTTVLALFQLQDDVISHVAELTDGARAPVLAALSPTLVYALGRRDVAIEGVHVLAPKASAAGSRVPVHARASGGDVTNGYEVVMPQVASMIDDELQLIDSLETDSPDLTAAGKKVLHDAATQALLSQRKVNRYWPPIPSEA